MQHSIPRPSATVDAVDSRRLPWLVLGLVLLFFAAPWGWEHKAHALMHGLCAQTPSHTLRFGSHSLPFDSRMTGIYGGFVSGFAYLTLRGRHRLAKLPSWPVIGILALFVIAMAVDGFNSLLLDLMRPHLYTPDNRLRLATGMETGIAIASAVCFLFGVSLWKRPNVGRAAVELRDLPVLVAVQAPFALAALSGFSILALPLTLLLVASALTAVSCIVLAAIVLFRCMENSYRSVSELDGIASVSLIVALAVVGSLAGGRFLLEHLLHLPPLT